MNNITRPQPPTVTDKEIQKLLLDSGINTVRKMAGYKPKQTPEQFFETDEVIPKQYLQYIIFVGGLLEHSVRFHPSSPISVEDKQVYLAGLHRCYWDLEKPLFSGDRYNRFGLSTLLTDTYNRFCNACFQRANLVVLYNTSQRLARILIPCPIGISEATWLDRINQNFQYIENAIDRDGEFKVYWRWVLTGDYR